MESTRRFLVLAGDRAIHLDPTAADAHYRRALELLPAEHPGWPAVRFKGAWAALAAGQTDAAGKAYEEAISASLKLGDHRAAGGAKAQLANLYRDRGDTASARALAQEAFALLRDGGPCVELAHALDFLAFQAWMTGRSAEALRWSTWMLEIADATGLDELRGHGLMMRGQARLDLDDPTGLEDVTSAVAVTRAVLDQGDTTVHGSWQLLNWQDNLAEALWLVDGTAAALNAAREAEQIAAQRGLLHPLTAIRADGLKVLFDAGRWEELLRTAREVSSQRAAHGGDYWRVLADIQRARVLVCRGELTSAAGLVAPALPRARSIGDLQVFGLVLEVAASLLLAEGRPHEAATRVRKFAGVAVRAPSRRAWHLPALVRVCTAAGELVPRL